MEGGRGRGRGAGREGPAEGRPAAVPQGAWSRGAPGRGAHHEIRGNPQQGVAAGGHVAQGEGRGTGRGSPQGNVPAAYEGGAIPQGAWSGRGGLPGRGDGAVGRGAHRGGPKGGVNGRGGPPGGVHGRGGPPGDVIGRGGPPGGINGGEGPQEGIQLQGPPVGGDNGGQRPAVRAAEGRRGARRPRGEMHDAVVSRPAECRKQGTSGVQLNLITNFFVLEKKPDWCIYQYRVDFNPAVEKTFDKKILMRNHRTSLGAYIFDGESLYVSSRLSPDPMELFSLDKNKMPIQLNVRLVANLDPTDSMYIQFFNIILRTIMGLMELEEIGRNFYNPKAAITMENERLVLWPGFKTSIRNHEHQTLLCVETTHKVLRLDSCLHIIKEARGDRAKIAEELIGSIVITKYNRKNYRVDDIDWNSNPTKTFEQNGEKISFVDYYKTKNAIIKDLSQPMLVSRPKKKDFHRGQTGPILLVPELCQMTGLSDAMRENRNLTTALTGHLSVPPEQRMSEVQAFIAKTQNTQAVRDEWTRWNLRLGNIPVSLNGRELPPEELYFGNGSNKLGRGGDFTELCKKHPMCKTIPLNKWVIIVSSRFADAADRLVSTMKDLKGIGMQAGPPKIIQLPRDRGQNYADGIEEAVREYRENLQLIVAILPNNNKDTYAVVKKRCCLEYGISSQCLLVKNTEPFRKFRSVCTKLVQQMNAKLGGQPWVISIPLRGLMILGFDVYHCGKNRGPSVGALVASMNKEVSSYYSTTSFHNNREELASNLCTDVTKCLHAYKLLNGSLPDRIIMYRDGVGEGQLTFVYNTELQQIENAVESVYNSFEAAKPRFTFIVVTKRINARIFQSVKPKGLQNPPGGTVVDDVITLPERFDFYLIPQSVQRGSVSPTSYNVLVDHQGLDADKLQRLTYKLCHVYYNWSGTVAVPAPCQYAHKLAYLTGTALGSSCSNRLTHHLYYL